MDKLTIDGYELKEYQHIIVLLEQRDITTDIAIDSILKIYKEYRNKHSLPLHDLKIETHVITGEMTKPNTRWCNTCKSHVCILDEPSKR